MCLFLAFGGINLLRKSPSPLVLGEDFKIHYNLNLIFSISYLNHLMEARINIVTPMLFLRSNCPKKQYTFTNMLSTCTMTYHLINYWLQMSIKYVALAITVTCLHKKILICESFYCILRITMCSSRCFPIVFFQMLDIPFG